MFTSKASWGTWDIFQIQRACVLQQNSELKKVISWCLNFEQSRLISFWAIQNIQNILIWLPLFLVRLLHIFGSEIIRNLHLYKILVWFGFLSVCSFGIKLELSCLRASSLLLKSRFDRLVWRISAFVHEHMVGKAVVFSQRRFNILLLQHLLVVECLCPGSVAFRTADLFMIHVFLWLMLMNVLFRRLMTLGA